MPPQVTTANARGIRPRNHAIVDQSPEVSSPAGNPPGQQWSRGKHDDIMDLCLGALYPCPDTVRDILAPNLRRKRVLDIGCGTGAWCVNMAKEFPHVEVLGIDRPDDGITARACDMPSNCRFEPRPDYEFLEEDRFKNQFDLIHMRFVAGGCPQINPVLYNIQTCLKPGGIFILIDSTGEILAEDGTTCIRRKSQRHPEGSRLRRLFYEVSSANHYQGSDPTMMTAILEDGLWDNPELVECNAAALRIPIGPWVTDSDNTDGKMLREVGLIMRQLLQSILHGHEYALTRVGFDERVLKRWHNEIIRELYDDSAKHYLDIRILWGRRKGGQRLSSAPVGPRHQYYRVYDQPESWKRMLDKRTLQGTGPPEHITTFVDKVYGSPPTPTRRHA